VLLSQPHFPMSPAPWRASGARPGIHFALALALGLAAGSAGAEVQGFHIVREVAVPAAGWVRVPLDLAAVQHMAPGGVDLHVFSRTGGEVPLRIEPAPPRSESRLVESFRLVPGGGGGGDAGWFLVVDVGPEPIPHERLLLTPVRPPLASPDRVESSPDGKAWQPLAQGAPQTVEGKAAVVYPVTPDRYLRLHWPRRPEAPRVSAIEVDSVIGPGLSVTSPNADCRPGSPGALVCTLSLPAAGQTARRLTLEVEGKGVVGYRVYAPRDARWIPLAEGVWQPISGRTRQLVTPTPEPVAGAILRLELQASALRPRLAGWSVDLDLRTVVFQADEAGTYTLAYGGGRRDARRTPPPAAGPAAWIAPGPERERDLPGLPAAATAPAVRFSERRLAGSWRIAAPSARPGTVVRLEIPARVYGVTRADLGNLRLLSGDRQIPFQRWSPEEPALASSDRDLRLQGSGGRRSAESEVELHLPEPGLPLSQIELTAPAAPLRRPTALRYLEPASTPAREVRRRERPVIIHDTWECRPQPPLPCRGLLPLPGHAPSVVEVSFHDGDNPPLAGLGADLWRRRDVLLFVWPESEEIVRLVAGPETLEAPSYDLQSTGDALLSYPWQPADLGEGRAPARAHPWWSRSVRPMILLAAVLGLLVLLRRILEGA
jgi:hypothetical protein